MEASQSLPVESTVQEPLLEPVRHDSPELDETPLPLEQGFFQSEQYHRIRGSVTRTLGTLAELPGDVLKVSSDLLAIARKEIREQKVAAFAQNEREALERVRHLHFGGWRKSWLEFQHVPAGPEYQLARMDWEGSEHPEHVMVWIHGWFGRIENFAEQAKSPYLRRFSQVAYNRPGTDAESAGIIDEPNYDPADHLCMNIYVLEQILDGEVAKGREKITLCGHSYGGIVIQSALDYLVEHRPDLYERINAAVLMNTTKETNVANGSFLDRFYMAGPLVKHGVEIGMRGYRLAGRLQERWCRPDGAEADQPDSLVAKRVKDVGAVMMTVGYFDSMVGGDAKCDPYLASKGGAKRNRAVNMIEDGRAMTRVPERRYLGKVTKPVFVISSGRDALLPDTGHGVAEQFVAANPKKHRVREFFFPDDGHCTPMTRPRVLNSLVHAIGEDSEQVLRRFGTRKQYRLKAIKAVD